MRSILSLPVLSLLCLAALTACDRPVAPAPPSSEPPGVSASAHAAAHGAPVVVPFTHTQSGIDPCTGEPQEVTFAGTVSFQFLANGNVVIRREYTVTTDTGYEGRGTLVQVDNGSVLRGHFNDIVTHPDGRAFRAHAVQVVDLKTVPPTIRVLKIHGLTCFKT